MNPFKRNTKRTTMHIPEIKEYPLEAIEEVAKSLSNYPISSIHFGINATSFKVYQSRRIRRKVEREKESLSFLKVNCGTFRGTGKRKMTLVYTWYTVGEDDNLWEITFDLYLDYMSSTGSWDTQVINTCNKICAGIIKCNFVNINLLYPIKVGEFEEVLEKKNYDGYIKTYGDSETYYDTSYGIKDLRERTAFSDEGDDTLENEIVNINNDEWLVQPIRTKKGKVKDNEIRPR